MAAAPRQDPNPTSHTSHLATHLWTSAPRSASAPSALHRGPERTDLRGPRRGVGRLPDPQGAEAPRRRACAAARSTGSPARMRVLARREPVNRRNARLVVTPGRPAVERRGGRQAREPVAATPTPTQPSPPAARPPPGRPASPPRPARCSTARDVVAVARLLRASSTGSGPPLPVALLVAWLVACRLMVKRERAGLPAPRSSQVAPRRLTEEPGRRRSTSLDADADTDARRSRRLPTDPALWDPVPVTLPTYVTKPRRAPHACAPSTSTPPASGPRAAPRPTAGSPATPRRPSAPSARRRPPRDKRDRAVGS